MSLDISVNTDGVPFVVIDNVFSDNQLKLIWREIEFFTSELKMSFPAYKGSDHENSGIVERSDQGIFLNNAFPNHQYSDLLFASRFLFDIDVRDELRKYPVFRGFDALNYDLQFLSYFQDKNFAKVEYNRCSYTIYTWLYKEPETFDGGELEFLQVVDGKTHSVKRKNNRAVIFLGPTPHEITEVKTKNKPYDTNSMYMLKSFGYMYPDR